MARRRRAKKTSHRRRRRVGAFGSGKIDFKKMATRLIGVAGGAFLARTLNNMVVKSAPSTDQKLIGGGDMVLGILIPKFIKNELGQGMGDGLLAIGSLTALQAFGAISGIGALPMRVPSRVIGAGDRPFLSRMVGATSRPIMRTMVGAATAGPKPFMHKAMGSAYAEMERMNRAGMGRLGRIGELQMQG